jgi:phospholipid N-methyltransferase
MTRQEIASQAINKAVTGQSMINYPAIIQGFIEKGIAIHDIKPRENVFTYHAWRAVGRQVKKGEKGVKVITWIDTEKQIKDENGNNKTEYGKRPWTTTVFHVSQTEIIDKNTENPITYDKPIEKTPEKAEKPFVNLAPKLRKLAEGLQAQIDNKMGDRLTNTPKRMKETAYARLEGEQLKRTQTVLNALADLYASGNVPDILKQFTTKKAIYDLMLSKKEGGNHDYYDAPYCTGQPYYNTEETRALWVLLTPKTPEEKQAEELKREKEKLQFSNIPNFFPTPENVARLMFEYAEIEPGMCVLEPSAGIGNLIKPIVDNVDTEILAYEQNWTLCHILEKSFPSYRVKVEQADFLEVTFCQGQYPRVIMNPPFENGGDIKHIKHAMTFLKEGGRLVALCANGPRQNEQLKPLADHWEVLPEGSFKQAGTNVNIALLVINN